MKSLPFALLSTCLLNLPAAAFAQSDSWTNSNKPMAQQVAQCLQKITEDNSEQSYATCKTSLQKAQTVAGTEAEVVLLEKMGLLTGYVHKEEQLSYYQQAVAAAERVYGMNDPRLIDPLVNTALVHKGKAAHREAAALFERAVNIGIKRTEKASQAATVSHYDYLVTALAAAGDRPAALVMARRAADYAETTLGPTHEDTGSAWTTVGVLEKESGNLPAAREYFVKSLKVWEAAKFQPYVRGAKEKILEVDSMMKQGKKPMR
jgi:tetratricopeptide (TPR) repeat protein